VDFRAARDSGNRAHLETAPGKGVIGGIPGFGVILLYRSQ
jgi:hypothetical protein